MLDFLGVFSINPKLEIQCFYETPKNLHPRIWGFLMYIFLWAKPTHSDVLWNPLSWCPIEINEISEIRGPPASQPFNPRHLRRRILVDFQMDPKNMAEKILFLDVFGRWRPNGGWCAWKGRVRCWHWWTAVNSGCLFWRWRYDGSWFTTKSFSMLRWWA